jgi:peptide/nickel transport system ATP-binding protein
VLEVEGLHVEIAMAAGTLHPVQDVGFHVGCGETLSLVGESGCGKSLTALAVMGLLPTRSRRVVQKLSLLGEEIRDAGERRMADIRGDRVSMIFQEPMTSLNPCYSIGNQLTEALRRHRSVSRGAARDRAVALLEKVGIIGAAGRLGQYPHQLSGGLRQRVMIAMALMCDPALIIADEPTTALDVTIQAQILSLLADLQSEFQMGLILITHDLGIVARVAQRVIVMYAGQVVETGTVGEVFARPLHPYTRGLLRCIPVPGRTRPGERLGSIPGLVPTLMGEIPGCHFANRCAWVDVACRSGRVPLRTLTGGRAVRCLLAAQGPGGAA